MSEILDASQWEAVESEYKPDLSQAEIEKVLASLSKLVPELTKAANDTGQDTTTLFALACMARLVASEHAMDLRYQISLVSDVLRQRIVSGYIGDSKSKREYINHLHPPDFLRKVRLYLSDNQTKALIKKLTEHQFTHNQFNGFWWAWSTPTRKQFAESVHKEYELLQESVEYD